MPLSKLVNLVVKVSCISNMLVHCLGHVPIALYNQSNEVAQRIVVNIAEQYYFRNYPTMVWSKNMIENDPLGLFRRRFTGCLLSTGTSENGQFLHKFYSNITPNHVTQYIIYVDHLKDFEHFVDQMKEESMFANYGKFAIIFNDSDQTAADCNAEILFDICWRYYLVDIIVLHQNHTTEVTISTYYPMEDGLCNRTKSKIYYTLAKCDEYQSVLNLFPHKLNNFNGCPFITSTVLAPPFAMTKLDTHGEEVFSGIEGEVFNIICKMLNATLKVIIRKTHGTLEGTHWTATFDDLMMRRANVSSITYLAIEPALTFRVVYPDRMTKVGWVSPPIPLRPAWEKLIKPFDFELRISFGILLFVLVLALVTLKETRLQGKWNAYFTMDVVSSNLYVNICSIFFGQVTARRPTKAVLSFCLALMIWFSFFMLNAYQGALISVLKEDVYQSELDTVSGAIKAGYGFGGSSALRTYFAEEPKLYELYKVMNHMELDKYLKMLTTKSQKFIVHLALELLPYYESFTNRTPFLHVMPNHVNQRYVGNYLQQDSPLEDTLSTMYACIIASGLLAHLEVESNFAKMENLRRQWNRRQDSPLTMHHMQAYFLLIIGGRVLALSVLLIKLIWQRYEQFRRSARLSQWKWKI